MRIFILIIMVLAFLIGGGGASALKFNIESRIGGRDATSEDIAAIYKEVEEVQKKINQFKKEGIDIEDIKDPSIQESVQLFKKVPPQWKVSTSSILGIVVAVIALFMIVLAFMKKEKVQIVSIAVIILSVLLWLIAPDIKAGTYSGANPKNIALFSFIALAISAGCAIMSYKIYLKKTT